MAKNKEIDRPFLEKLLDFLAGSSTLKKAAKQGEKQMPKAIPAQNKILATPNQPQVIGAPYPRTPIKTRTPVK